MMLAVRVVPETVTLCGREAVPYVVLTAPGKVDDAVMVAEASVHCA